MQPVKENVVDLFFHLKNKKSHCVLPLHLFSPPTPKNIWSKTRSIYLKMVLTWSGMLRLGFPF